MTGSETLTDRDIAALQALWLEAQLPSGLDVHAFIAQSTLARFPPTVLARLCAMTAQTMSDVFSEGTADPSAVGGLSALIAGTQSADQ